jgi:cytochrome c553
MEIALIRRLLRTARSSLLALAAGSAMTHGQAAPAFIEDTMAQRMAACTVCHGKEGRAAPDGYRPRIAGKPATYLYNQLLNFRDGRRHYGPMVRLADPLSDAALHEVAEYFASLDLPYAAPTATRVPPAEWARGQQLALRGDAAAQLPACADCHGRLLTGVLPATPGLLGLPREYLAAQLGAWQTGLRRAHAPDCMGQVAKRLGGTDVAAVSAWLSSQAVPSNSRSAPAQAQNSPKAWALNCGGARAPER